MLFHRHLPGFLFGLTEIPEPSKEDRQEPPEEESQVWRAKCSACDFVFEATESIARHDGQMHRQETGHSVWLCFDLIGVGSGWL